MNALRALLLLSAVAALAACGRSDRSSRTDDAQGVTVELPPFEPEQYVAADEPENAATSLNVMVPAALEGEAPPAPRPEPPKPAVKPPEPDPALPEKTAAAKAVPAPPGKAAEAATVPAAKADESAPRPSAATARLPISNERVASTIDRIGFPCGQVTGASPVEGASIPTWRISCSSGATYRGTSRDGHMRFRKWSGN